MDTEETSEESSVSPDNIYSEACVHNEVPVSVARDNEGTNMTPDYLMIMYIYVKSIDIDDNKTWRTIYREINEPYLEKLNFSLKILLINAKIIQTRHRIFHLKLKIKLK